MSTLDTRTIEEVTDVLIDYRGKTPRKATSGVKLLTAKVIKDGRITNGPHEYIAAEDYDSWMRRGLPRQGDILITTEAPLGEVARLRTAERVALAQRVILLRGNPALVDQTYYFYALRSPYVQQQLMSRATGTTVLGIKQSELREVRIPWHPLETQRRIAAVLSAYDDLIENNLRRLAIFEEMAQAVYREWFVEYRFPGHEGVSVSELDIGWLPSGWESAPLSDLAEILSGGTPSTRVAGYWGGTIPFFTPKDAGTSSWVMCTEKSITPPGLDSCNSRLYPKGTVFITARGTVGKAVLAGTDMAMNQSCYALRGRNGVSQYFLFHALRECSQSLRQNAHGAVFDTITVDTFARVRAIRPPSALVYRFDQLVTPIMELQLNLMECNARLRETRDLLLPRLVSGELIV